MLRLHVYVCMYVCMYVQMWQSHVEIKDYSVMYFDCIPTFKMPYCQIFIKGGARVCRCMSLRSAYEPCP